MSNKLIEAYPLHWPPSWPRTKNVTLSAFKINSDSRARDELVREVERLGGKGLIMSTNIKLRNDGLPYSGQRIPDDSGVAIYFKLKGKDMCIAADQYRHPRDNMWALKKSIEALRGLERWGVSELLNRAFQGFQQLEAPVNQSPFAVLGLALQSPLEECKEARNALAKKYHPDAGTEPDPERMTSINNAYEEIKSCRI